MTNKIKQYRQARNMTLEQLAEKACCSAKSVNNYERGSNRPDVIQAKLIADALGTTIDALFFGKDEKPDGN